MENQINGEIMGQTYFADGNANVAKAEEADVTAFKKFGLIAVIFGVIYTFCLYKNTSGITYPFYMAGTLALIAWARKSEGLSIFRDRDGKMGLNLFFIISLMLLSISKCTTANRTLLWGDGFAIYLLTFSFLLHMYIDTRQWDLTSHILGILVTTLSPLAKFVDPIVDSTTWFKSRRKGVSIENKKTLVAVFAGIIIALPLLIIVLALLASADIIFSDVLDKMMNLLEFPIPDNFWDVVGVGFMFVFGYWLFYTVAKVLYRKEVKIDNRNGSFNAVTAITFSSLLAIVYLFFSVIQIVFLFMGNMTLPEKYTYAEYAHEGFYQLLTVSILNFVIVSVCQKLFNESKALKAILFVIGLCTYIMIASSAFRMFMYISAYNLTFLRVLVLWFLAVLGICLAYLMASLFDRNFPVYKLSMITVTVLYIALVFAHPDYFIAKYDLKMVGGALEAKMYSYDTALGQPVTHYLTREISADAVPAFADYPELLEEYRADDYYDSDVSYIVEYKEVREFNFARYKAYKLCSPYQKK